MATTVTHGIDKGKLLEKYKKIYFDAEYYLEQKALAHNWTLEQARNSISTSLLTT